jgi:hypothetical protein
MFVLTTVLAVVMALCFVVPDLLAGIAVFLVVLFLSAAFAIGAKYGSQRLSAICIGALVPIGGSACGLIANSHWQGVLSDLGSSSASQATADVRLERLLNGFQRLRGWGAIGLRCR